MAMFTERAIEPYLALCIASSKRFSQPHVDAYRISRAHLSDKTVSNHITLAISILRLAHEAGWLRKVPKLRKPKVRVFDHDYRYLKTESEIDRLLAAARPEGPVVFGMYCAAIYTGMRAGELAALRWSRVDFDRRLVTVDASYDGPTKGNDVRYVPIMTPLLKVLHEYRLQSPGDIVFPNQRGGMQGESGRIFQEILHRVLDRAEFPRLRLSGRGRWHISFHDLRHTFASQWMMNGSDLFKLQKN